MRSQKQTLHFKVPLNIDFDFSITCEHGTQLCALFTQFEDNDVKKEKNVPEFWKINWRIGFDLLEMQMARSEKVSIIVWSRYITLKLFWILEIDVIKGRLFHIFHPTFYKYFAILAFSNKYSPFVPIFIITDPRLAPI